MKTNKETRTAFLSTILGDGWISKTGSGGITHCEAQRDYLEWKRDYLLAAGVSCGEVKSFDNSGYPGCKLYINTTRYTKLYRKVMYPFGIKDVYKRKFLDRFSAEHLAIWYMDDGGLSQKMRGGEVYANDLMLNTHTSRENNQVLIDYFAEVWSVKFTQVKNRGHYRLRCGTKQARKFIDIVREYVSQVPSMAHKIKIKASYPFNPGCRAKWLETGFNL